MLRGIFSQSASQGDWGVVKLNGEFDEVAVHSRCYLLFGPRIRSECAARKQGTGSSKAKSAYGLQIRWNGPGDKAMGW
jgi:hypothetical protein